MNILDNPITKRIFRLRAAYRAIFAPGPAADIVMADLRKFCRGTSTPAVVSPITQTVDPLATGIAIGRQEVWHRICQNLHLDDADLYKFVEKSSQETE